MLRALWATNKKQEQFEKQLNEAQEFYRRKIEKAKLTAEFVREQLKAYLEATKQKSLSTPNGTFFLKKQTYRKWGSDDSVLEWARKNCPDAIKTNETVNKNLAYKTVKETGNIPPDFTEETVTTLQVRE